MPNRALKLFVFSFLVLGFGFPVLFAEPAPGNRVQLTLDASEADQVLAILKLSAGSKPVDDSQWQRLFATEPYQGLKKREAEIGQRFHDPTLALTDDGFKKFVLSDDLRDRVGELSSTLDTWKKADLQASADRALAYLPASATIRAKVYAMIKPNSNSLSGDRHLTELSSYILIQESAARSLRTPSRMRCITSGWVASVLCTIRKSPLYRILHERQLTGWDRSAKAWPCSLPREGQMSIPTPPARPRNMRVGSTTWPTSTGTSERLTASSAIRSAESFPTGTP